MILPLLPEIIIASSSLLLLVLGAVFEDGKFKIRSGRIIELSIITLIIALFVLNKNYTEGVVTLFSELFILDYFAFFFKILLLVTTIFILILVLHENAKQNFVKFEFPILILLSLIGMMVMVSAGNLISLYIGLELQSLSLYILAAFNRDNSKSAEAGLKYFMLGALASGILLYGISLVYGFSGTTNFIDISDLLLQLNNDAGLGILVGFILIFIAICFKLAAVPFHMWAPDVYEGSPKIVTAFFAVVPKIAAIAVMVRLLYQPFIDIFISWQQIVIFVSIVSMLVGSFAALKQKNIKRLMAYSSIGHVGFIMVALATGTGAGISAIVTYTIIYVVMSIGTFICIIAMNREEKAVEEINDLAGLAKKQPLFAFIFALLMFSMAGIPPLAGFFGKLLVFRAAIEAELYILVVIGVVLSVVSAYYYLRIVKVIYFDKPEQDLDKISGFDLKLPLFLAAIFNLFFVLAPEYLLDISDKVAAFF